MLRGDEEGRGALRGSLVQHTPGPGRVSLRWSLCPLNAADTLFPWSDPAAACLPLDLDLSHF